MRRLRTALAVTLLALGASSVAEAQQPQGAPQGGRRMAPLAQVERMLDSITLTSEQTAKIDAIKKKYEPEVTALMQQMREARQNGGDMQPLMQKRTEIFGKAETEVRAVLTAEQAAVFDKNKAAMEEMRRQRQGGNRPPRG